MKIQRQTIEAIVALLERRYPGWQGFADARFVRGESEAIRRTSARAQKLLGFQALRGLIDQHDYREVIERIDRLGRSSPLMYTGTSAEGDLNILHHPRLEVAVFCEVFLELIHGSDSSVERLGSYLEWTTKQGLPSKWTFPTFFLMLCHPESDMFVKPAVIRWAHRLLGSSDAWTSNPTPGAYAATLHLAERLASDLAKYAPEDRIDIFAMIRAAGREAELVKYWQIAPGENAWQWKECRRGNFIGIGWELFGDISKMTKGEFQSRHKEILKSFPDLKKDSAWNRKSVAQLWAFRGIQPGDRIVANKGNREILGTGTVTGGYYFLPGERNGHRLPVRWSREGAGTIEQQKWWAPLKEIDSEDLVEMGVGLEPVPEAQEPADVTEDSPALPEESPVVQEQSIEYGAERTPPTSLPDVAAATGLPIERLQEWIAAIERKGQAIIYGPPGTGKTFVAGHLARHIVGDGEGLLEMVQFHPSYSYEEFILGIRPETRSDGSVRYPLTPGRFIEFCERARRRDGRSVLIIDEINRADLPRVFGELMYLLEYRDAEVTLAGGRRFSIPANVRIIGTMNTADRSIALVDNALRRRFAFLPLGPEMQVLRHYHERAATGFDVEPLIAMLERLNREIEDRHYQLGISYFLRDDLATSLPSIWRLEIEPYLEEFFYDRPELVERYRWGRVMNNE